MSQDLYKEKYVKYKSKYLSLKNVDGGATLSAGRYFFYVPVSVFNTIVAHIYFTKLNKSIAMSTKSSSATAAATAAATAVVGTASVPILFLEGPGSEVILNIMDTNQHPSYQVQPGNTTFTNLKTNRKINVFDEHERKFGIPVASTVPAKSSSSKKPSVEVSEAQIKTDIAIVENKAKENLKTQQITEEYVSIHYQVNGISKPNLFYATTNISTTDTHPMQTHLNAIKTAIENTRVNTASIRLK
jgi:hypothetical protein